MLMSRVTVTKRYILRFYVMLDVDRALRLFATNVGVNAYEVAIQVPMMDQIFQSQQHASSQSNDRTLTLFIQYVAIKTQSRRLVISNFRVRKTQ